MPLIKPKKVDADSPARPESLAMAFGMQRRSKKMAKGGLVDLRAESEKGNSAPLASGGSKMDSAYSESMSKNMAPLKSSPMDKMPKDQAKSESMDTESEHEEHYSSIADAILAKSRKSKMMAEGGMVDIDENEEPAMLPEGGDEEATRFGEDMSDEDQPMDSNEMGDDLKDEDSHDMVDVIRRKVMAKRGR